MGMLRKSLREAHRAGEHEKYVRQEASRTEAVRATTKKEDPMMGASRGQLQYQQKEMGRKGREEVERENESSKSGQAALKMERATRDLGGARTPPYQGAKK